MAARIGAFAVDVALAVFVTATLLLAAGCQTTYGVAVEELPGAKLTGAQLFVRQSCHVCHGAAGRGGFMRPGPSLVDAAGFWSRDDLARYLDDPAAWSALDPRLGEKSMPGFPMLDLDQRLRLADYVIGLAPG